MRRQLSPRGHHLAARLIRRAERAAYRIGPCLLALVIVLAVLNLTCYIVMRSLT